MNLHCCIYKGAEKGHNVITFSVSAMTLDSYACGWIVGCQISGHVNLKDPTRMRHISGSCQCALGEIRRIPYHQHHLATVPCHTMANFANWSQAELGPICNNRSVPVISSRLSLALAIGNQALDLSVQLWGWFWEVWYRFCIRFSSPFIISLGPRRYTCWWL